MRYIVASVVLAVMFVGSVLLNLWMSERAVQASQHQWCTVLVLLTARPVSPPADPKAHKAQEGQYIFYLHLRDLEGRFGC